MIYHVCSKEAIENAEKAFEKWQSVTPASKAAVFRKAASLVTEERYVKKIIPAVVEETGCVAPGAKYVNVDICVAALNEACDMAYTIKGEILPSDLGAQSFVQKLPMGVM